MTRTLSRSAGPRPPRLRRQWLVALTLWLTGCSTLMSPGEVVLSPNHARLGEQGTRTLSREVELCKKTYLSLFTRGDVSYAEALARLPPSRPTQRVAFLTVDERVTRFLVLYERSCFVFQAHYIVGESTRELEGGALEEPGRQEPEARASAPDASRAEATSPEQEPDLPFEPADEPIEEPMEDRMRALVGRWVRVTTPRGYELTGELRAVQGEEFVIRLEDGSETSARIDYVEQIERVTAPPEPVRRPEPPPAREEPRPTGEVLEFAGRQSFASSVVTLSKWTGELVRVELRSGKERRGEVMRLSGETLFLKRSNGTVLALPLDQLRRVQRMK